MGATGLDFLSGTHDDMVIGNVFTEIAGNGISVGKFTASETTEYHVPYNPADKNEICTNESIKDNYVHHVTTEFQGGIGIVGGYPRGISIEHNEIAYVNYSGISVGYGWTSTVNAMSNNKINYNDLLKQMKEDVAENNAERVKQGYPAIELVGWAAPPRYDAATHKLYWAKAYDVPGPEQQLNYDIRILGRAGHLELSIMSGMSEWKDVKDKAPTILSMVDFTEGNRYTDYKSGDKVAAYSIAGLITGGILAKAGFFKLIGVFLLKAWKLVAVAVVAIGAWIKKLLGRRSTA